MALLLLVLAALATTLLLAACGDATATTGPVAQTTPTTPATTTPVPTTGPASTTKPATTPTTTAPATTTSPTKTATPGATPGATGPINLGHPFYLKIGETATISNPNLTLKFVRISEDSRCPASDGKKMVACAWSGQVSAVLEVKHENDSTETITLTSFGGTSPKLPAMAVKNFGDYQLQLLTVEPHPIIDQQINPADYVVTLQIVPAPAQTVPATTNPAPPLSPTTAPTTKAPSQTPAATAGTTGGATEVQVGPVSLGQPFSLKMGQYAVPSGTNLKLKFVRISEDSRCPDANPQTGKSVECFWSGQVTADIEVSENGRVSQTVKLTLPGSVNTHTTSKAQVGNYQLEVKEILPRAVLDVDINPADYVVTLVISQ
ncbi:MAG: hypothetical protein J0I20_04915 [Chloroflexi bacterium]|nr:hypothetical protein [Chloroflexota bacterium]